MRLGGLGLTPSRRRLIVTTHLTDGSGISDQGGRLRSSEEHC